MDVQAGVTYKDMNKELSRYGLFFPPDPGANATVGGMVANNASGIRTIKYGSTKDNVPGPGDRSGFRSDHESGNPGP